MGSRRMPGKVLAQIGSKTLLYCVLERLSVAKRVDSILVATTKLVEDDRIARESAADGFEVFRGNTFDVLDRFHTAVKNRPHEIVVRVTSDCPLVSPELVDEAIAALEENHVDYASNARPQSTFPEGLDVEVFTRAALERAWREATRNSDREHVTPYVWRNPGLFRLHNLRCPETLPRVRLTVDEPIDLHFMKELFQLIDAAGLPWRDVVTWVAENRQRLPNNLVIPRDAGYIQSLAQENFLEQHLADGR